MPKTCLLLLLGTVGVFPALSSTVTYTNQADFLAAAAATPDTTTELETFSGPAVTAPGLSVVTHGGWHPNGAGYGYIANGEWNDCVGRDCDVISDSTTVWTFAKPIYAFGATFDYAGWQLSPGFSPGLSLNYGLVDPPIQNGFFGFVSDQPMSSVVVTENAWADFIPEVPEQLYRMDNLYFAEDSPVPEPATWALLLVGAGLLVGKRRL